MEMSNPVFFLDLEGPVRAAVDMGRKKIKLSAGGGI